MAALNLVEAFVGQTVRITCVFTTDNVEADPEAVTATVTKPDGTTSALTTNKKGATVSTYEVLYTPSAEGRHYITVQGDYNTASEFAINEYIVAAKDTA